MIRSLKSLFADLGQLPEQAEDRRRTGQLAAMALLIELSRSDHSVESSEIKSILAVAEQCFQLDKESIALLYAEAERQNSEATSLYEFTDTINRLYEKNEKIKLIENLWQVAYADDSLDKYEDHMIRKVAELIYVSHSDFIRAKHCAQERANKPDNTP